MGLKDYVKNKYNKFIDFLPTEEVESLITAANTFLKDKGVYAWLKKLDKGAREKFRQALSDKSARRMLLILLSLAIPTKLLYRVIMGIVDIEDVKLVNSDDKSITITLLDYGVLKFIRTDGDWTCTLGPEGASAEVPLTKGIDALLKKFKVKPPWHSNDVEDQTGNSNSSDEEE